VSIEQFHVFLDAMIEGLEKGSAGKNLEGNRYMAGALVTAQRIKNAATAMVPPPEKE